MTRRKGYSKDTLVVVAGAVVLAAGALMAFLSHSCNGSSGSPGASTASGTGQGKQGEPASRARVTGRVLDSDGKPISGVLVELFVGRGQALWPAGKTTTKEDGRFGVEVTAHGMLHVVVFKAGKERMHLVRRFVPAPGRETCLPVDLGEIKLSVGVSYSGRVVDPDKKPIPDAWVAMVEDPGPGKGSPRPRWPFLTRTDADGRFKIHGLRPGEYTFWFYKQGYVRRTTDETRVPGPSKEIVLDPLLLLSGRVVHQGQPVEGAEVTLAGSGLWPKRRVRTAKDGAFTFPGLPEGLYEVQARKKDLASDVLWGVEISRENREGRAASVILELKLGVRLMGVVRDAATGRPLTEARILITEGFLSPTARRGRTDKQGRFVFLGVLSGKYNMTVEAEGYLAVVARPITVRPAPAPDDACWKTSAAQRWERPDAGAPQTDPCEQLLSLFLERGAEVAGQVVDHVGKEVAGARIEVFSSGQGARVSQRSEEIDQVRQQMLEMERSGRDEGSDKSLKDFKRAPPGLGVLGAPLLLPPVSDITGEAAVGGGDPGRRGGQPAHLHVAEGTYITNKRGRFRITGLPPGDAVLLVNHSRYARLQSDPLRLRAGRKTEGLRLVLLPGLTLEGRVTGLGNEALSGVHVMAASDREAFHRAVTFTDEHGRFVLKHLSEKVRLELSGPRYVSLVEIVDLRKIAGPRGEPGRITLSMRRADRWLRGVVEDSRGLPVAEAVVEVVSLSAASPGQAVTHTGSDGRFMVDRLGPIPYLVRLHHPDRPTVEYRSLKLDGEHRLRMGYGGGISGLVRDKSSRALVSSVELFLKQKGRPEVSRVFASGRFEWAALPSGWHRVTITALGYAPSVKRIKIPEANAPRQITSRDLVWELQQAGSITGLVRDQAMFPVAGAVVECRGLIQGSEPARTVTDRKGRFVLLDLPPGLCTLSATHQDKGKGSVTDLKVKAGETTRDVLVELDGRPSAAAAPRSSVAVRLAEKGSAVIVAEVTPRTNAERAGLSRGDELVAVDGESTEGVGLDDLQRRLRGPVGTRVVLKIRRDGKTLMISVKREVLP